MTAALLHMVLRTQSQGCHVLPLGEKKMYIFERKKKSDKTKQTKTKVLKAEGLGGLPVCLFSAVVELKQIVVGLLILSYIENNL